ncbi:MAG TPA: DUF3887 domain-containing protein [Coleofasciculaceae cyanobacterium]
MQLHSSLSGMSLVKFGSLLLTAAIGISALPAIAQSSPSTPSRSADEIAQASQPKPMTTIAEEFVNLAAQGDFAAASQYLHPSLRQTWSPADMQQSWENLEQRTGAFQQVLSFKQADASVVLANTKFENLTDDLVIIFDDSHQWIVGVDFPAQ